MKSKYGGRHLTCTYQQKTCSLPLHLGYSKQVISVTIQLHHQLCGFKESFINASLILIIDDLRILINTGVRPSRMVRWPAGQWAGNWPLGAKHADMCEEQMEMVESPPACDLHNSLVNGGDHYCY